MGEIKKENILQIYGVAHIATLSPNTIKATFQKTGVHPFNPSVITPETLAPSCPTSIESNLPVPPPTPMRIITNLLQELSKEDNVRLTTINEDDENSPPPSPSEA